MVPVTTGTAPDTLYPRQHPLRQAPVAAWSDCWRPGYTSVSECCRATRSSLTPTARERCVAVATSALNAVTSSADPHDLAFVAELVGFIERVQPEEFAARVTADGESLVGFIERVKRDEPASRAAVVEAELARPGSRPPW